MTTPTIQEMDPKVLIPSPENLRGDVGDTTELEQSIRSSGVLSPILARPIVEEETVTGFEIVAGHRRTVAAIKVDLPTVPVIVRRMTDDQRDEAMLIENLQRADLNPVEEATGYFRLTERGMTIETLAERVGRSPDTVSQRLELLMLDNAALDALRQGQINLDDCRYLLKAQAGKATKAQVRELLMQAKEGRPIDHATNSVLASNDRTEKTKKLMAALKKDKTPHVIKPAGQYDHVKGLRVLERGQRDTAGRIPYDVAKLDVDVADHKDEPCHGLYVILSGHSDPQVLQACLEPARHTKAGKSTVKPVTPPRAGKSDAEKEREAKEKERAEQERARIQTAVEGMRKVDVERLAVQALVATAGAEELRKAVVFLGVEPLRKPKLSGFSGKPELDKRGNEKTEVDYEGTIDALFADRKTRTKALAAVLVAVTRAIWGGHGEGSPKAALKAAVADAIEEIAPTPKKAPRTKKAAGDDPADERPVEDVQLPPEVDDQRDGSPTGAIVGTASNGDRVTIAEVEHGDLGEPSGPVGGTWPLSEEGDEDLADVDLQLTGNRDVAGVEDGAGQVVSDADTGL